MHKLTFAAGFAVGYTLGAKAGRERYSQIMRTLHNVAESPAVQEAAGVLQAQASDLVETAKRTVGEKVSQTVGGHAPSGGRSHAPYPAAGTGSTNGFAGGSNL